MRRLPQVFSFCTALFFLAFSTVYAEGEPDFIPGQLSPEVQDSLKSTNEPTLQEVLDGLGYSIDVENDRLPIEIWVTLAGQYGQIMLAEIAEYSDQTVSGWYCAGNPSDTHHVFGAANTPTDTAHFYITGCDSNGLFIAPHAGGGKCHYRYYTEPCLNADHKDHAWVYCSGQRPNEFIIAWEDLWELGDADFQDLVLLYQMPTRPPILSVPDDDSYNLCFAQTICFGPITASDEDYCDSVYISMISGPGTFEGDSCCFMPANVDSTYEFVFVATDLAGAADTESVEITVEVNQPPQIVCPPDDSVHAGEEFVSGNFSVSDPKCWPKVRLCGIDPSPVNQPIKVNKHVEWQTDCADAGIFTICLEATDSCGARDTCYFEVTVYNQPPVLTCPNNGNVHAGNTFTSGDFSFSDPEGDPTTVTFLDITPGATNSPTVVSSHVEWLTTCAEDGDYTIRLVATDSCGAKDTCQFTVNVYNQPPVLTCPENDSINAGDLLTSTDYSVIDPDDSTLVVVTLDSIFPAPTYSPTLVSNHVEWLTSCADLVNGPNFTIILIATDPCGAADTCQFTVTVYNLPPEIVCPADDSVHAGELFISTDFSVSDPKAEPVTVALCGVTPTPVNSPTIVAKHVEWQTDCADANNIFTICLEATDSCGAKDTCHFEVTVYNQPPILTCPDDDSINAGDFFISTDYSVTDPDDPSGVVVTFHSISPTSTNSPTLVNKHVEWLTRCDDLVNGPDFTITLIATDPCGAKDTCEFTVTVYNLPPEIVCPADDSVHAGELFISTDFSVSDPKAEPVTVALCGVTPTPVNSPTIVAKHVEWQTDCADANNIFTICLEATDSCGAKDTCYFEVTVYNDPPQLTCPDDGSVYAPQTFVSTDFSVTDPDGDSAPVTFLNITPSANNNPTIVSNHVEWVTTFSEDGDYIIRLVATDPCGLADTCEFTVTVINEPTGDFSCPEDDSVHAGDTFVSTYFTVTYPECDPSTVAFLDINPSATNNPTVVGDHVEWVTTCAEDGDYIIRLRTTEDCIVEDTCEFTVTVYNRPPQLICPDYGIVCPGFWFVSTDFFVTDPDEDFVSVTILDIDPPATNDPMIVGSHVEWFATCAELDISYVIRLVATDPCGLKDTCEFTVSVSCQPTPDFLLSVDPNTQYVVAGHAVGYAVELISLLGFANPCSLFVSGLPDPPDSGVFDQAVLIPPNSTTLNIYTTTETDTGWYTLSITAKEVSGPIHHTVQVHLKVQIASDAGDWADNTNTPKSFALFQNQPNPFNPETKISYHLPRACQVRLTIYNVLGQKVKTLFDGHQAAGLQTLFWDGRGDNGVQLSSGIYFYRLQADSFQETKKMTLMK